jgi:hypothetical protein
LRITAFQLAQINRLGPSRLAGAGLAGGADLRGGGWEPVFPRAIRRACGEPGWSVLQARLIDLIAWTMLALLAMWLWPKFQQMLK